MTPLEALNQAIDRAGLTIAGFAQTLGVRQSAVSNWRSRMAIGTQEVVPAEYCPEIERMTGVRCERLNPLVDWGYVRRSGRKSK